MPHKKLFTTFSLFLIFLLNFHIKASGQATSYSMTLKEAVSYALQNHADVQNALLDEQIAKKKVAEVRGIGLPQVSGSAELNDFIRRPTQILPGDFFGQPGKLVPIQFGTKYNMTLGVTASQLIFDGSYFVGLQAAKTYTDLAANNANLTKRDMAVNVTKAYYSVQVAENRLNILEANLTRLRKTHSDAQVMFDNGFIEKIDVDRLKVSLNNLEVEREKVLSLIDLSKNLLKFQMGIPIEAELKLEDSLTDGNFQMPAETDLDLNKRIEYKLLQNQRQLNFLDMRRHQVGYLPSLAAFGNLNTQAQRDEFNFLNDGPWYSATIIGARLTLPIFDGFQKSARVQQARLELAKTDNLIRNTENALSLELQNALLQYRNNYKTMLTVKENLELAEEVVRVSQIKYEQGVGSNLEVITAEASLKEVQTNYFSALYDLLISKVDYEKAQGDFKFE